MLPHRESTFDNIKWQHFTKAVLVAVDNRISQDHNEIGQSQL